MNTKTWLKYFVYIILIFGMIYLRKYVNYKFTPQLDKKFINNFNYLITDLFTGVGIGLLLGIEHLTGEIKRDGRWKINLPKVFLMGLPLLYFSFTNFFIFCNNQFLQNIIAYPLFRFFRHASSYASLFQLILGYIIITSLYKSKNKTTKVDVSSSTTINSAN